MNLLKSIKNYLKKNKVNSKQLGTFWGVYLPAVLNMFGVIVFLRFGWIVGRAGIAKSVLFVSFSSLITFITVLSITAIATNRFVGSGGSYYLLSRSFGIQVGAAIGIPLYLAQTISIITCTLGFSESLHYIIPAISSKMIAFSTLGGMAAFTYFSTKNTLKVQLVVFVVLILAFLSLFTGKVVDVEKFKDIPHITSTLPFWSCFALFFPAATGLEAGIAMSGNLKNPRRSLPLGTLFTLLTGYVTYLLMIYKFHKAAPLYLLASEPMMIKHIARFSSLIILGIWAATLSSALACLLSAPRTLQALAKDGVFPKFLAKEFGKAKEPRISVFITAVLGVLGVNFGSINMILPILSMSILISYGMLNLVTFLEELISNPSWRPTFKVPAIVSFIGFVLCFIAMVMIDAGWAISAISFIMIVYFLVTKRKIPKKIDDIRQGILLFLTRFIIYRLTNAKPSFRSWKPNLLVFTDVLTQPTSLLSFASDLTAKKGFLTMASILSSENVAIDKIHRWKKVIKNFLKKNNIHALVEVNIAKNNISGIKKTISNYGLGPITPNIIALTEDNCTSDIIKHACLEKRNVIVIKNTEKPYLVEEEIKKFLLKRKAKDIDIWWDDDSRDNSELMILLSYLLQRSNNWKKSNIILKSIVPNETAKQQRIKYFNEFLEKSRFNIQTQVFVCNEKGSLPYLIRNFSQNTGIALFGLRKPKENESNDDYSSYYKNYLAACKNLNTAIFVMSSEHMEFQEIFK